MADVGHKCLARRDPKRGPSQYEELRRPLQQDVLVRCMLAAAGMGMRHLNRKEAKNICEHVIG